MTPRLKPYPAYKDSGVPWLGDLPAHWEVRRLKTVCQFAYGDSLPEELREAGDTPVFGSNGVVGKHSASNTLAPCLVIGRKGSFGKVNYSAIPVFAIDTTFFVDRKCTDADLRWLYYLLTWARLDTVSKDSAVPGLSREDAYQYLDPFPPLPEQHAIARFLDHIDGRINRTIRAKRQLIALLNEQKQAIIHRAVTRGLDPDVALRPSGVEWLGEIPAHWEVVRLATLAHSFQTGPFGTQLHSHDYQVGGTPVINPSHMKNGRILADPRSAIGDQKLKELLQHRLLEGDIILARRGELGRCALVTQTEKGWICGTGSLRLRVNREMVDASYLTRVISSKGIGSWLSIQSVGSTMENLNTGILRRLSVPLPPMDEQRAIIEHINDAETRSENTTERIGREIDLIREYRTRLIADVVTGKLDVRAAAAGLPEELAAGEEWAAEESAEWDEAAEPMDAEEILG